MKDKELIIIAILCILIGSISLILVFPAAEKNDKEDYIIVKVKSAKKINNNLVLDVDVIETQKVIIYGYKNNSLPKEGDTLIVKIVNEPIIIGTEFVEVKKN